MRKSARIVVVVLLAWVALTVILRTIARPSPAETTMDSRGGTRLVVLVHGLSGADALQPVVDLARTTFADADFLTFRYDARPLSNADVFAVTGELESAIHSAYSTGRYQSTLLVGHSLGAMVARKALLWGHGLEEDRKAPKGKRPWVDSVDRMVSLAGINRGWSIDPAPENMGPGRFLGFWIGEVIARLTGTSQLLLATQRGAPFIADSRVQWIRLTRGLTREGERRVLPRVVHLLGDRDDIVSRDDATDLGVAKDTVFVTLAGTDHANIVAVDSPQRREAVRRAMLGDVAHLDTDKAQGLAEEPDIRRVVYVMHGIRDWGGWTDRVRTEIQTRIAARQTAGAATEVAVVNKKYGYFPILRFLLYWDRQNNVRRFMDEYTENVARYPYAGEFDFVGHSNGTYILASALQRYRTVDVDRVYFAGSVLPKHYPWRRLFDEGRVRRVVNVVASGDWVVAIFPKVFEQFADWLRVQPTTGLLDIGAAGFRGFQAADDPKGRLVNVEFADGMHGIGVDTEDRAKLAAIVSYILDGDENQLAVFRNVAAPWTWLDVLSNVSWLVWIALAGVVTWLGVAILKQHTPAGLLYVVIVIGLLMSI
jgi:pimeloyl-ACP methyl ester carboxylesterase